MITGNALGCDRAHVDEVDVDPVDPGHKLRKGVQLRLGLAPVIVLFPVAHEFPQPCDLHALRRIGDGFLVGPAGRSQAPLQVGEIGVGELDLKRPNWVPVLSAAAATIADDAPTTLAARTLRPSRRAEFEYSASTITPTTISAARNTT